jgi:hypothetical protein
VGINELRYDSNNAHRGIVTRFAWGSKLRRVYDGPKTPFERVVASKQGDTAQLTLTILKELRRSLDPFQLAKVIDRKLERIYRLANRRLSPKAQENLESSQAKSGRRKGSGKDAAWKSPKAGFSTPLGNSHKPRDSRFPTATTTTSLLRLHIKWLGGDR